LKSKGRQVDLITIRSPIPTRYGKILHSISKIAEVHLVTGTLLPTVHLKMRIDTVLGYTMLLVKSFKRSGPALVDNVALHSAQPRSKKDLVVDFRTPFPLELAWLGHRSLASLARAFERTLKDLPLVLAANERMASLCKELGAVFVQVIPNYPTTSFKPTVEPEKWKIQHGLSSEDRVVLFTGGVRLREIYGLDLLLEAWRLVENLQPSAVLVIIGDDSIPYAKGRIRSLNIRRYLLEGRINFSGVANWINSADVCLAPRTPGFPRSLYDDEDSTKISEYAALEKPIVAAGYAPSSQYLLVAQNPEDFAEGIMQGFDGKISNPKPHYWEENEESMLRLLEDFWFR
jgi:glycosyltransferase involved in cell wall biosynthesis